MHGGGFSPGKLRSMLLGVEKKRKEDDDFESRSQLTHVHESSSGTFSSYFSFLEFFRTIYIYRYRYIKHCVIESK